tara:strand:+ start:467 stop:754 length:288 start_codon:yes stop_codon:yes gene_type:complete
MSKSIENLILLQSNIEKLKLLIIELKNENLNINNVLNSKDQLLLKQTNDLKQWKEKYQSLKIANTFLVSNDKSLTKLKINNMIKDLDRCIMNLSS